MGRAFSFQFGMKAHTWCILWERYVYRKFKLQLFVHVCGCVRVMQGDTQIRYFEVTDEAPYVFFLSMYQSTTGQRSVCFLPKRELDVMKCEVMRFFKLQNNMVEPIAMTVPRKVSSSSLLASGST